MLPLNPKPLNPKPYSIIETCSPITQGLQPDTLQKTSYPEHQKSPKALHSMGLLAQKP